MNDIYENLNLEIFDFLSNYQRMNHLIQTKTGLTISQLTILRFLYKNGPSRITAISAELKMDPGNVSNICFRLQKTGLIERKSLDSDRRVSIVLISEGTMERVKPFLEMANSVYLLTTEPLSPDKTKTIIDAFTILNRYYENIFQSIKDPT